MSTSTDLTTGVERQAFLTAKTDQAIEMARVGFRFVGAVGDRELLSGSGIESFQRVRAEGRPIA